MPESVHSAWPPGAQQLQVGDLRLDLRYRRVGGADGDVELSPRLFDLLQLFLAEPRVLHTRASLLARVWPGLIVEDGNLSQSVWMLRKALGAERKDWIRTVAKRGYVFELPEGLEVVVEASRCEASSVALPPPAPASIESRAARTRPWRSRGARFGVAAAAVIAGVAVAGTFASRRAPTISEVPPALAVALIEVDDSAVSPQSRWPAKLLHAWLEWKLSSLPEASVLSEAHLAADAATNLPRIVLLSSGPSSSEPELVFVRARIDGSSEDQQIELRGRPSEVPAMVDALSQQVVARLLPTRATASWPALNADAEAAQRFTDAFVAHQRRDWAGSAAIAEDVLRVAPKFGLARYLLAQAQSRLGQASAAVAQMSEARTALMPLPEDAADVLDAQQLALHPERAVEAADAFAALAARHPNRATFALEQARELLRAERAQEALAILVQPEWEQAPIGVRIAWLLDLGEVRLALGDPELGRRHARQAERLAGEAGEGWELERARALALRARADVKQYREKADVSAFEEAARLCEAFGAKLDALRLRFLAESSRLEAASTDKLDTLLAQARAAGYRRAEVEILRRVAFQHYTAGRMDEYRARLEQALATATATGDVAGMQQLTVDLLHEDVLRGDPASAERRLASLRGTRLQGERRSWIDMLEYQGLFSQGRYAQALAVLDRGERLLGVDATSIGADAPSLPVARYACMRAEVFLTQGDLMRADSALARCGALDHLYTRQQAALGRTVADVLAGNRAVARTRLRELLAAAPQYPDGPDRWIYAIQVASLALRGGLVEEAERLYTQYLPAVRGAEYGLLVAHAHSGLAEVAAARGDYETSEEHIAKARREPVAATWVLSNRLDELDLVIALARGKHEQAEALARNLDAAAHANGDVVVQLEVHSLLSPEARLPGCSAADRAVLSAQSGMRGATLDWLIGPIAASRQVLLAEQK